MPENKKIAIGEFEFISRYMKPLTMNFSGALQLGDDIAIIPKDKTTDYVITLDTIVEDRHFIKAAKPEQIANKLLRSNLSDIASCGGTPKFYMLTGNLADDMNEPWLKRFTAELLKIQKKYKFSLLGGDTVRSGKSKFFSVTMIGEVPKGKALLRSGAKIGDDIYISGKIGEAWVGLNIIQKKLRIPKQQQQRFINEHYSPEPRIELGNKLINIANSCTDISDGLLKDLSNICITSNVSAQINAATIPLALPIASFQQKLESSLTSKEQKLFIDQITAGDDYELIFTAHPRHSEKIKKLKCVRIGKIVANGKKPRIMILDSKNKEIKFKRMGYEH